MDGEGTERGRQSQPRWPGRKQRQGDACSVPSAGAGEGIWGHRRRAALLGSSPSCHMQTSCAGADPCREFPFNALQSEGVSKTAGILGKLSQSFPLAALPYFLTVQLSGARAVAIYFRTLQGCMQVLTHPGSSLHSIRLRISSGMKPRWDRTHRLHSGCLGQCS